MTTTLNWSERDEPNAAGYKDCTYSSGLTGMVFSGFTNFAKGIYTVEEREALERSDDQPNETGASTSDLCVAIKRRYGKIKAVNSAAALSGILDTRHKGVAVQGKLSNFPVGHKLRRWQPGFTGGHMVFVFRQADGTYRWFDPLAPMKFAGDVVTKANVLTFAKGLGSSVTFTSDEYKPVVVTPLPKTYTQAEMDAVRAELAVALAAKEETRRALEESSNNLSAALMKIANAKVALA